MIYYTLIDDVYKRLASQQINVKSFEINDNQGLLLKCYDERTEYEMKIRIKQPHISSQEDIVGASLTDIHITDCTTMYGHVTLHSNYVVVTTSQGSTVIIQSGAQ